VSLLLRLLDAVAPPRGGGPALPYREGRKRKDWKEVLAEIRQGMEPAAPAVVTVAKQPAPGAPEILTPTSVFEDLLNLQKAQEAVAEYAQSQADLLLLRAQEAFAMDEDDAAIALLLAT
jgi:hypothetical protein